MIFQIRKKKAEIAQLVEHNLAKVGVASSSLVFRSFFFAQMAELVDACVSGAHAARCAGSSPVLGTRLGYYSRDSQHSCSITLRNALRSSHRLKSAGALIKGEK